MHARLSVMLLGSPSRIPLAPALEVPLDALLGCLPGGYAAAAGPATALSSQQHIDLTITIILCSNFLDPQQPGPADARKNHLDALSRYPI